jgi:Dolichyl-phosphate-mannose-protein mannosyltransferase
VIGMSAFAGIRRGDGPIGKIALGVRSAIPPGRGFLSSDAFFIYACVLAWPVLLFAYTWMNAFPSAWHWDEPSKVQQILTDDWNFNHPQLLLTATRVVLWLFDRTPSAQGVLLAGRFCSAAFTAASVVVLALLAKKLSGNLAGWCALLWIGSGAFTFGLAHYFKEDTALIFGLSVFAFFLTRFEESPIATHAVFLGIGAGLAASGKYIGLAVLPLALIGAFLLARKVGSGSVRLTVIVAVSSLATFALVNLSGLTHLFAFSGAMKREFLHVLTEHGGFISPITDPVLVAQVLTCANLALLGLLAFIVLRRNELRRRFVLAALILLPLLFLALAQLSVIKLERYTLPTIVFVQCLGACGIAGLAATGSAALRIAAAAVFLIGLAMNVSQFATTIDTMRHGSRTDVAAWIRSHVPANSTIAESPTVELNADSVPYPKLPQTFVPIGSFDQMRAQGVQYLVVSDRSYDRFLSGNLRLAAGLSGEQAAKQTADFTRVLANSRRLIDEPSAGLNGLYFSPRLTVYEFDQQNCTANLC